MTILILSLLHQPPWPYIDKTFLSRYLVIQGSARSSCFMPLSRALVLNEQLKFLLLFAFSVDEYYANLIFYINDGNKTSKDQHSYCLFYNRYLS